MTDIARPFAWYMSGTSLIELATHETLPPEDMHERAKYGWRPLYLHGQPDQRDCRTCRNHNSGSCVSVLRCVDGAAYQRGMAVRLWEKTC